MWDILPVIYLLTPTGDAFIIEQDIITSPGTALIIILVRSPTDTVYIGTPIPAGVSHLVCHMVG